jgi:hypothetical protein
MNLIDIKYKSIIKLANRLVLDSKIVIIITLLLTKYCYATQNLIWKILCDVHFIIMSKQTVKSNILESIHV